MKKCIYVFVSFLLSSFINCHYLDASQDGKPTIFSGTGVKIEIYEDGKVSGRKLLADYFFKQDQQGKWYGYWRHILISPFDDDKSVALKIESWSTENGEITNFQAFKAGCSFDIDVSRALYGNRMIQIIIKEENSRELVLGSALWYSKILERDLKVEWKSTDKLYFELPYTKVF